MMASSHYLRRATLAILPVGLTACGPTELEKQTCRDLPAVLNQEARDAFARFKDTEAGRKYMAMTLQQRVQASKEYPQLQDMDAYLNFNARIEGAQRRYNAGMKHCAQKGL